MPFLSNISYSSATPLNFADFGEPAHISTWAPVGSGKSRRSSPPPPPSGRLKKLCLFVGPFATFFFLWGDLYLYVGGLFRPYGGPFWECPYLQKFLRHP